MYIHMALAWLVNAELQIFRTPDRPTERLELGLHMIVRLKTQRSPTCTQQQYRPVLALTIAIIQRPSKLEGSEIPQRAQGLSTVGSGAYEGRKNALKRLKQFNQSCLKGLPKRSRPTGLRALYMGSSSGTRIVWVCVLFLKSVKKDEGWFQRQHFPREVRCTYITPEGGIQDIATKTDATAGLSCLPSGTWTTRMPGRAWASQPLPEIWRRYPGSPVTQILSQGLA